MDPFVVEEGDYQRLRFWWKPPRNYTIRITIPSSRFANLKLGRYEDYREGSPVTSWLHENIEHGHWAITSRDIGLNTHRVEVYFVHLTDATSFVLRWGDV